MCCFSQHALSVTCVSKCVCGRGGRGAPIYPRGASIYVIHINVFEGSVIGDDDNE